MKALRSLLNEPWHAESTDQVSAKLESVPGLGLSSEEATSIVLRHLWRGGCHRRTNPSSLILS